MADNVEGSEPAGSAPPQGVSADAHSRQGEWSKVLGGMAKGETLSPTMQVSASLCQPTSGVEKGFDARARIGILLEVANAKTDEEEIRAVTRMVMSFLTKEVFDGRKPLNPIQNEVEIGVWDHGEEAGKTISISEQVDHSGQRVAEYAENSKLGIKIHGWYQGKAAFLGNSVHISLSSGERKITLKNGHRYEYTTPGLSIRGLFVGTKGIEWVDQAVIRGIDTGLVCKVTFKPLGWLGMWGKWNQVEGEIKRVESGKMKKKKTLLYTIKGEWSGKVNITDAKTKETSEFWDFDDVQKQYAGKLSMLPMEDRDETDTFKVWDKVRDAIKKGDVETANKEKNAVEERQRAIRKDLKDKGKKAEGIYFEELPKGAGFKPREDAIAALQLKLLSL